MWVGRWIVVLQKCQKFISKISPLISLVVVKIRNERILMVLYCQENIVISPWKHTLTKFSDEVFLGALRVKSQENLHLKMFVYVCWIFLQTFQTCFCIHVDPDQTAGAVWSGSTLFAKMTFKNHKQMTKQMTVVVIGSLTLKAPRKSASENVVCSCHLLHLLANFSNLHFAHRQTVWTQIRLLLKEQSDLGPHCLHQWLLK